MRNIHPVPVSDEVGKYLKKKQKPPIERNLKPRLSNAVIGKFSASQISGAPENRSEMEILYDMQRSGPQPDSRHRLRP